MASNLWTLDDFKDFETIDKIFFSNNTDCIKNDDEGYTPLCFAALNGAAPECIAYFMWKANRSDIFNKCNRGKTPLQFACMAMNINIINVLTTNSYKYIRKNNSGDPVYKLDVYGDPAIINGGKRPLYNKIPWRKDANGYIYYNVGGIDTISSTNGDMSDTSDFYICATIQPADILSAASLPKSDILQAFIDSYMSQYDIESIDFSNILDNANNNPLHLAVTNQCYSSVKFILLKDTDAEKTVNSKNKEENTPFDIALNLGDTGIQEILIIYTSLDLNSSVDLLDKIAKYYFSKLENISDSSDILTKMFSSKYTFRLLSNKYTLVDQHTQCTLLEYCRNKDDTTKNEIIDSLYSIFTNHLCTESKPTNGAIILTASYQAFIEKIVDIRFAELITYLYNSLEDIRLLDKDKDPDWIKDITGNYLKINSSWVDRESILDDIEDSIRSNIIKSKYNNIEDYFTGKSDDDFNDNKHDVIPIELWDLDTLIVNNLDVALKRLWVGFNSELKVSEEQRSKIESAVIAGNMNYDLVKSYFSPISNYITNKKYDILNWLHGYDHISNDDLLLIISAVNNSQLDQDSLNGWPWYNLVTLYFTNTNPKYSNLDVELPKDITGAPGDTIILPQIDGQYNIGNTLWKPLKWDIGEFNAEYILNTNTVANLEFTDITEYVTISFKNIDYTYLNIDLPDSINASINTVIKLPTISGIFKDQNNILWEPKFWKINNKSYTFESNFKLTSNIDAYLICEKAVVTIKFINTCDGATFANWPDPISCESGTVINLPANLGDYIDNENNITYTPKRWSINDIDYEFGSQFTLKENTSASCLIYSRHSDVPIIDVIFNHDEQSLTEGESFVKSFVLASEPTSNVVLTFSLNQPELSDRLHFSNSSLTFTSDDWDIAKLITFSAVDNNTVDTKQANMSVNINVSSADTNYNNFDAGSFNVIIKDNDIAGIDFITTDIKLDEGSTKSRTFKLKSKPTSDVTLKLLTDLSSDYLFIFPQQLIFTQDNWSTSQRVSFTANNDDIAGDKDGTINIKTISDDINYNNIATTPFKVLINDNDTAGILFDHSLLLLYEGQLSSRAFALKSKPLTNVSLKLTSESSRISFTNNTLTFTSTNWDKPQYVEIKAVNNSIADGDESTTINITVTSSDRNYNNIKDSFNIRVIDNDVSGIEFSKSSITLVEGTSGMRTFRLKSQPKANVVLNISSNNSSRLSISKSLLTFTPNNWSVAQQVGFYAVDNSIEDGGKTVSVTVKSTSTDTVYNNITSAFSITIKDNDVKENIGTYAFSSGIFTVLFVDDDKTIPWSIKANNGSYSTSEPNVKNMWSSIYDDGYTVTQVPKSPYWPNKDKAFYYDLLYDDKLDD